MGECERGAHTGLLITLLGLPAARAPRQGTDVPPRPQSVLWLSRNKGQKCQGSKATPKRKRQLKSWVRGYGAAGLSGASGLGVSEEGREERKPGPAGLLEAAWPLRPFPHASDCLE